MTKREWAAAALGAVLAVLAVPAAAGPAVALDLTVPFGNMMWNGTGYLYVEAGETVSLDLRGRQGTYTATRPDGTPVEFVHDDGTPAGTTCSVPCMAEITATETGVWELTATTAEPFNTVNTYPQRVTVLDADGTEIPGRFFFETLSGSQHRLAQTDVKMWALSPYGTQYEVDLFGLSGYGSIFRFSNLGVVYADSCTPTYFSTPDGTSPEPGGLDHTQFTIADDCPNLVQYRIFPEQPDPDMPADVALWADGRSSGTWLNPVYVAPTLGAPTFTPADTTTQAGAISFELTGQHGRVTVGIDVDGDGELTGDRDVVLPTVDAALGVSTVTWDGLDGLGDPVPATQQVTVLASYSGQDEIHFAMEDFEGLWGGLQVRKLTGPDAGSTAVSWDDTKLITRTGDEWPSSPLAGEKVDSTGGVRGWGRPTSGIIAGWGDKRLMDTWAMADVIVEAEAVIPARTASLSVTKTAATPVLTAGGSVAYQVTVHNDGNAAATQVVLTDDLVQGADVAAELSSVSADLGTVSWSADAPENMVWTIDLLDVGDTAVLDYVLTVVDENDEQDRVLDNWAFLGQERPQECVAPGCAAAQVTVPGVMVEPTDPTDPTGTTEPPGGSLASTGAGIPVTTLLLVGLAAVGGGAALTLRRREAGRL